MKAVSRQFKVGALPVALRSSASPQGHPLKAYLELTKPRVNLLVVLTSAAGFYLGSQGEIDRPLLLSTLVGTGLLASGSAAINQYLERDLDARMVRTATRPLPSGRLTPAAALIFGTGLITLGTIVLSLLVNPLACAIGLLTVLLYVAIYTPLKTRTALCTTVGAIPGALPPIIGWAGAGNDLGFGAAALFLILLFWQFPHFLAISWAYRQDYREGGFEMLSKADPDGRRTASRIVLYSLILALVSILPSVVGMTGEVYIVGAVFSSIVLLYFGARAAKVRSKSVARDLSLATVFHLPLLLVLMIVDKA